MDTVDIKALNERIQQESSFVDMINMEMNKVIVGQKHLVEGLLIGMLSNGHILLEGVPGLAKTLAINTLATTIDAKFSRIQFTPDLLPADVIGTMIYSQKREEFVVKQGPIFANFILADEINRAPATVCFIGSDAGTSGDDRRYDLSFARAFPGYGHPESDRTGRYLSVT